MKKFVCFFLFFIIISSIIFSQEIEPKQEKIQNEKERMYTINISPLLMFWNIITIGWTATIYGFDLEGQYKLNDRFNASLSASFSLGLRDYYYNYTDKKFTTNIIGNYQVVFKPMFIYKPFKTGLKGYFAALYLNIGWCLFYKHIFSSEQWFYKYVDETVFQIGTGLYTGYKWIFKNGFTLQLQSGIGKTFNIPDLYINAINADGRFSPWNFDFQILNVKIGYSF